MVIAPQTPKRATVRHKKRTGQHQKQTKRYMKTYWPYLPMLTLAFAINGLLQGHIGDRTSPVLASDTPATRLQFWTHTSNAVIMSVGALIFVLLMYVFMRHARAWHRVLVKGEDFVINHHMIDASLIGLALVGILITRSV